MDELVDKKRTFSKMIGKNVAENDNSDSEDDNEKEQGQTGLRTISEKVLSVLLDKHTTTYKEVSDFITTSENKKLSLTDPSECLGNAFYQGQDYQENKKEANRKRIKNLRRRVYDSLNVFLACDIFIKDKKKVTFNMDYYECLPAEYQEVVRINQPKFGYVIPQIKKEAYENSDVESEKETEVAPVERV